MKGFRTFCTIHILHMSKVGPEIFARLEQRSVWKATSFPERERSSIVLGSDIEGPWFKGDFIAEAMAINLHPRNGGIDASPSYGQIIYQESWDLFTGETLASRRPLGRRRLNSGDLKMDPLSFSRSQEGTDTIFTLPFLLAEGANYDQLKQLTLESKQTPGSKLLVDTLENQGVFVLGITTAPQEPYRDLAEATGFIDPKRIVGSPFPMEEARRLLQETGAWDREMSMTKDFLEECYALIDTNSTFTDDSGIKQRKLSEKGKQQLQQRIKRYYDSELGISYDFRTRQQKEPHTLTGKIIHASDMVGDRAKAAVSQNLFRRANGDGRVLVTMGDGGNDAMMLQMAPISIGVNGADAAAAAKIGVITPSMEYVVPIFEQILKGQRNVDVIITKAQQQVGDKAIIHRGGPLSEFHKAEHKRMKKELRGDNITY